ncbi:hypothetical protein HAX54_039688, partial [Datura stramonium]|nr:hypothetical protein [Datura stramonium]
AIGDSPTGCDINSKIAVELPILVITPGSNHHISVSPDETPVSIRKMMIRRPAQ